MNGFSTEEDSRDGPPAAPFYGQSCCLIDDGDRCVRPAGNASFSKRIQKSISQKKLKLDIDKSVSRGLRRLRLPGVPRALRGAEPGSVLGSGRGMQAAPSRGAERRAAGSFGLGGRAALRFGGCPAVLMRVSCRNTLVLLGEINGADCYLELSVTDSVN